ncbi:putative gamma-glutamylcyclotransferase At3g02910 [Arachis stenosperma]|uniref:putative gamma-glutamylcyclotransferase At3g02910 n=1 Tax=Arachis stenosperma TaxID=217475 RepID=UPI0025ABA547|nr:putative gamma-glutamylcyclotransferase At3g02910 [Arachis stenosperma]
MVVGEEEREHLIFVYGTLKRGLPNYPLMEGLMAGNDAVLVGSYSTEEPHPLVLGPNGIPYLINLPGSGQRVKGEVYSVSDRALSLLDDFEGLSVGHYERLPVRVAEVGGDAVEAEAYFVQRGFGEGLWKKKGEVGLKEYGVEEAKEYVRKENRKPGSNAVDEVREFVLSC